ncbi:nuclear transport factor 2 family protein [Nocardioides sp.]|jgi:steroid delta-isomerase|uniref:nuclear transport factor 2 family protein n=1 Tax=Nocardioides sp. TaxID=35761 RepID=UPI0031FEBF67|nr:ksi [Nocardioides sp.]
MAASEERIREVVERYVALVATGSADEIADLYAEGATVEDPVGSEVLTSREQIHGFYATLEVLDQETRLIEARITGGEAAFLFEVRTTSDGVTYSLSPIDVMTFDDDGLVTSMRAFWGPGDLGTA